MFLADSFRCSLLAVATSCLLAQDPSARREALARAAADMSSVPQSPPAVPGLGAQSGPLRLIDVSLDILAAAGTSTERDAVLRDLQGGGHDPKKRGFTLQQAELSLAGAVDSYLLAKAYLITLLDPQEGETVVELEEAYLQTTQLPAGLQLKAGSYFTEFGRINPLHPHAWDWQDQPVVHTRLFGADGMRGPGARLSWLLPTDTYGEVFVGVQNANGETMTSFLANEETYAERPIGGRAFTAREVRAANDVVYTGRAATSIDLAATTSLGLGASAAFGPNATGGGADTLIWGGDFVLRWRPLEAERGWPFVKVQGEYLVRRFDAEPQIDAADPLNPVAVPGDTLVDQGAYVQLLWGFTTGWAAGMRADWATGSGLGYDAATQSMRGRTDDPFRADRVRLSPMIAWHPSEFSRLRLQYTYDDSDHLADPVHSVWLGFEVLIGTHPAHGY